MSETTVAATETAAPAAIPVVPPSPTPPAPPTATEPIQLPDDHPLVKTLAAQKEQIRELKALSAQHAAAEDAGKTEAQKLADRLAALELERDAARKEAFAASKGVPASALTGTTPDEWEAAATALLTWRGTVTAPRAPSPQEAGAGQQGTDVGSQKQLSREELAKLSPQERLQAAKDGRIADLLKH